MWQNRVRARRDQYYVETLRLSRASVHRLFLHDVLL